MPMLSMPRLHPRWFSRGAEKISVVAYVRRDEFGTGPSFSLYRKSVEIARFDLFPVGAHRHRAVEPGQPRHYYPPGLTLAEYLDLAIADLVRDFPAAAGAVGWIRQQIPELAVLAVEA